MKKFKAIIFTVIALAVIVAILINNKMNMAAKTQVENYTETPVVVVSPVKQKLSDSFSLVGTTQANNDVAIASETQGKVKDVFVNVGDHVQAGSPLIKVDDELKQANFEAADVNYQKAKRDLERFESLRKDNSVTDAQIEQARLGFKAAEAQYTVARRQLNDTKISSPISGIVTSRPFDIGAMIQPGMIIANVIDISKLKVKVSVSEKDVFRLNAGNSVQASTDIYPDASFTGTIKSISSKGDESHTYPVEITLPNSSAHPLKAGMFMRVHFSSGTERTAMTIPRDALVGTMKKPQVFIVENNLAVLRDIVVGTESANHVEVLSGLNGDELLVTSGKFNLKDSSKVSIAKNESENN